MENIILPLTPVVPAFGDLIFKLPLDEIVETPVAIDTNPPVPPPAFPPVITVLPPCPCVVLEPVPLVKLISPAR